MRHRMRSRKLSRTSAHRKALFRNLVTSLLDHERIETTDAKAKELRRVADRMITLGKRGDVHARRRALRVIRSRDVASKVFSELAERYRERPGGYTRVLKLGSRVGDNAPLSVVELVDRGEAPPRKARAEAKGEKAEAPKRAPRRKKKTAAEAASAEGGRRKDTKTAAKKATARKAGTKKTARKRSSRKKSD